MKRLAAFAAAIGLLTGGLVAGIAAPASADTLVGTYGDLVTAVAAASDTVQLSGDIAQDPSTLAVDAGDSVTIDLHGFDLTLTGRDDHPGVGVPATSTLTLIDTVGGGVVRAVSADALFSGAAGIGTTSGNAGTIVIDGAHVNATGVLLGAGIGGGGGGSATIQILSGDVIAASGDTGGAAIGSGANAPGGTITISGGAVHATGFYEGAGIGGGNNGDGGTILITGGSVDSRNLTPGVTIDSGAGIGGGANGAGGLITITGGVVDALGGRHGGAGIGGGANAGAGTIDLQGGDIDATAGDAGAAAIGTGALFPGFISPTATVAGSPTPGSAVKAGEGFTSRAVNYSPDGTAGVTYTASSVDSNGINFATASLNWQYAVTFDPAGGIPDPADQDVAWDASAIEPTEPTRAGYLFDGWHVDTAGGVLWDFSDPVTEPLDLVAAWIELPAISGSPPDGAVGAAYNYAMTVSPAGATVTLLSGSLPAGLTVDGAGVISGIPTTIGSASAALRASYLGNVADIVVQIDIVAGADQLITFDSNGGSLVSNQMVGLGEKVIEPADPTQAGFAFIEWRVGSDAGPAYDFNQVVTGPLNLVAAWGEQPTLTGPATRSGTAGDPLVLVQLASTPPGNTVGISSGTLPTGLTFTPGTLQVTGTPNGLAGTYPVTFTATNAYGVANHVVTFTIGHGVATSFTTTASDFTPNQGDTITVTTIASDGFGNSWDAAADDTITSDVATDVIVGNQVTFPHASPHLLNVAMPNLPAQQLLIQVTARSALGLTGSDGARTALPIAIFAILCGTSLMLLRRRREA